MKRIAISVASMLSVAMMSGYAIAQSAPMVQGTVQKVDEASEKITIDHAKIPNLDMDAMTMVFKAGDKAMLKQVKAGDKVQFAADRVNGQITITRIQKAR